MLCETDTTGITAAGLPRPGRRSAGFTLFEVTVVISLMALIFAALGPLFSSNTSLVEDSRALQRAQAAHRRNMEALSRVLRSVDVQTLTGFNPSGVSTAPKFSRVTGADYEDLTYTGPEELLWVASPVNVDGVAKPGAVYLVQNTRRVLVADRVPAGGFRVRQEGQSLVVQLETYWTTNAGRTVTTSGESVISIRN